MKRCCVILLIFLAGIFQGTPRVWAQTPARQYFLWALQEYNDGRIAEAGGALERASDFIDELSDISFLRALVDERENKGRREVLKNIERAIAVSGWMYFTEVRARHMAAEYLIALRYYRDALAQLARVPDNADSAILKLTALKGIAFHSAADDDSVMRTSAHNKAEFRRFILETMDRYPRDPRVLRIFFDYANSQIGSGEDALISDADYFLLEMGLKQLPLVVEADPELAWMASPFIRDRENARRLVAAYRAGSLSPVRNENFRPHPESIACALGLSLISGAQAIEELFEAEIIDRNLIEALSGLMAAEDSRFEFMRRLLSFTGVITVDDNRDGIPEGKVHYYDGALQDYYLDEDQDGITDLHISFINGIPQCAVLLPELKGPAGTIPVTGQALIQWEKYPFVDQLKADGLVYIFCPMEFQYAPVRWAELSGTDDYSGLLFPCPEYSSGTALPPGSSGIRLNRRILDFYALQIQRPSLEFEGAVEIIDMELGIPWRATEILNGQPVSITEFVNGRPVLQQVDLDKDSRMETLRSFRNADHLFNGDILDYPKILQFSQSDWNGDGFYETAEEYLSDGSIVYYWDMDGSGIKNYSERRAGNNTHETIQE